MISNLANFYRINIQYEILYTGRSQVLLFCSCMTSSRFEAYVSAKFLSDGKCGAFGLLHAAFGGK